MFLKYYLCLILFSKQTLLLGNALPPVIVNNESFTSDSNSLSTYSKYEQWYPRVINGFPAKLGDVPYQISLKTLYKRSRSLYLTICGAVIIGPRKLLSAAHCFLLEKVTSDCNMIFYPGEVSSSTLNKIYAVAGTLRNFERYDSNGQWRALEKVQFPITFDYPVDDIAVVVPKYRFYYNNHVGPIPMASQDADYKGKCLVSGYGKIGPYDDAENSPILLMAYLSVLPNKMCSEWNGQPADDWICTSIWFTDVGTGDSGGPLVCANTGDPNEEKNGKGVLVGIVSGSMVNEMTIFTRVSRHQDFINSVNSVSLPMYNFNIQSCTAITIVLICKTFVLS